MSTEQETAVGVEGGAPADGAVDLAAPARVALPAGSSATRVTPGRREEIAIGLAQSAIFAGMLVAGAGVPVL